MGETGERLLLGLRLLPGNESILVLQHGGACAPWRTPWTQLHTGQLYGIQIMSNSR